MLVRSSSVPRSAGQPLCTNLHLAMLFQEDPQGFSSDASALPTVQGSEQSSLSGSTGQAAASSLYDSTAGARQMLSQFSQSFAEGAATVAAFAMPARMKGSPEEDGQQGGSPRSDGAVQQVLVSPVAGADVYKATQVETFSL